jgi:hypothetical protein
MRIYFFFLIKIKNYFYLVFVITGFFIEIVFIFVDEVSVDCRCFIGDLLLLLSLEEDIKHREANDFSSTELIDDCRSRFGLDDFELSDVVSLLNRKKKER